jgi:hypothetical protein
VREALERLGVTSLCLHLASAGNETSGSPLDGPECSDRLQTTRRSGGEEIACQGVTDAILADGGEYPAQKKRPSGHLNVTTREAGQTPWR